MSSAQVGKTELLLNVIGYFIHQDPSPVLMLQPTVEMAEAIAKDRIAPMVRDSPVLVSLVADPRARDSGNTILHKRFRGGHLTLAGANSPAALASRPIRVFLADEIDRYPVSAGPEGDPVSLGRKRTATFWNRVEMLTSTPTVAGASRIEIAWNQSDQRYYEVPCRKCGEYAALSWENVDYPDGNPEKAEYFCRSCGGVWTEAERLAGVRRGVWRATRPFTGVAGFHLSELYSPWRRLADIARDYEAAKAAPEMLRVWWNTSLGLPYEDPGERADVSLLMDRAEDATGGLAPGVRVLTAGVDVQGDRLELEVVGWGEGEESWSVDYLVLPGNPTQPEVWDDLTHALGARYRTAAGGELSIAAVGIDTGYLVRRVYEWCAASPLLAWPLKGMTGQRPVIESGNVRAKRIAAVQVKGRFRPYLVGVDEAKLILYRRIAKVAKPGPGYVHVPRGRDEEWFLQLTAETLVTRPGGVREWVKARPRNEALDCRVYAYAALKLLAPDLSAPPEVTPVPIPYRPAVRAFRGGGRRR